MLNSHLKTAVEDILSERHQKTFISAREFVESWDKEIYELKNLDFFIFQMINHLGNQLDRRFFIRERSESPLKLSFDNIATLCFNIGDSFEYFLEGDDERSDAPGERFDFEANFGARERDGGRLEQRIQTLRIFLAEGVQHEQRFRVDLMENVILDTLLQFYYEEMGMEFGEDNLEIIELADFIEEVLVSFVRNEGQVLLQRPNDPAIDFFEEMLGSEDDYDDARPWDEEEDEGGVEPAEWDDNDFQYQDVNEAVRHFLEEDRRQELVALPQMDRHMALFREYLVDEAGISNIHDLEERHLLEFMSVWLVQKFAQRREPNFQHLFQSLARFVTWLHSQYQIDLKRSFLKFYEKVKLEIPRLVRVLHAYLEEYDLFEVLLLRDQPGINQMTGFYEIGDVRNRVRKSFDLTNIHFRDTVTNVKLDAAIFSRLKPGDILHATLVQKGEQWTVLEIHFIYPRVARPFLN